ncbi:MAG: response regulator transcription factor [Bacillota bacterium]|nr:response regulator transcription factor [Bacillota bacterium]
MYDILLVEDDGTLAVGIEYALKNEGFNVAVANSAANAENLLKSRQFEMILLDVMLPDGNGYDLCRSLRKISDIPVIFLTACDEEVNVVLGLDIGGDDYITKPFRLKELISRINAVLRRRGKENSQNNGRLVSGSIQVFTLQGKVKKDNEDLQLTALEYRLLLTLIKHPNQVMGRNAILEALWDFAGEFVDDNTLSVYIKRLREKIGDNLTGPRYILTVRGLGYKWNCDVRGE